MADLEFGLLGPLAVRRDGVTVPVAAGRQRALLAALLLNAGRVVGTDELIEVLWDAAPPPSARVSLHNYVRRLRQALDDRAHHRISTHPHGYMISIEPDGLDVARFQALERDARAAARAGSWEAAGGALRDALALWRGPALADVDSAVLAQREVPRLEEMRMQALEARIDADLNLGRHGEAIAELRHLADCHPLREHLHALLMLALYRDARQAEALVAYQHAREVLAEELGVEPGPVLQEVHQRILTADPALGAAQPARAADSPAPTRPQELPAPVAHFTGRSSELASLTRLLDAAADQVPATVVISAIGGTAGVGKTALAVHWAHQAAHRFGDGQLYVNLRGFDPTGTPVTSAQAIRGFLDALGVPPERIPPQPEAQARLYRRLLADRNMLIVLDNARDEQQVRPLLPASPASLVLVTSRSLLAGLVATNSARLLSLDVLTHGEAVQLLTARLTSGRAAAEPDAVDQIASLCAGLPLALAVAAARAEARPGFPLAALVAELCVAVDRLDALDAGDPAVSLRTVFSWSYQQLSTEAARMFRLLSIHPGPDLSVPAAASLARRAQPQARRLLGELARTHLIVEHLPGRYALHDLLRAYAAAQARDIDTETERRAAVGRLLDYYLHTGRSAAALLNPAQEPLALAPPALGAVPEQLADHQQALNWFEAERHALLAAVTLAAESGFDGHAWQIPWAMGDFLHVRVFWNERAAIQHTAMAASARLGDAAGQAISRRLLASACRNLGDYGQAITHYMASLTLYRRLGDTLGEAKVHDALSVLANHQGRHADALCHAEQGLRLLEIGEDKAAEAVALNSVGWCHGLLGDYQQARVFCRRALALSADIGFRWLEGSIWDSLGYAEHNLSNFSEATACYQRGLSIARGLGNRLGEAQTLDHLGDTHHAVGDLPQAREAWQQALTVLDDMQYPGADQVRAKLDAMSGP